MQYKEELQGILKKIGKCMFICESMAAVAGMTMLPEGYLRMVYELVREKGGVTVADEV